MRAHFKTREAKDRTYSRTLKKEFLDNQLNKLPNELRYALTDYNHNCYGGHNQIDENDYGHK